MWLSDVAGLTPTSLTACYSTWLFQRFVAKLEELENLETQLLAFLGIRALIAKLEKLETEVF